MPETKPELSSGVAETLLIPLYIRATESQRPDALIRDEKAVALAMQSGLDFSQVRQIRVPELLNVMRNLFTREFDRYARDFIGRQPEAVVVHIGCGLDSRFERVAARDSRVEWYDLDLPEVIALRRELLGDAGGRYHLLACSRDRFPGAELVFDGWRPFEVRLGNRYLAGSLYAGLMRWGFWRGQEIERWGDGIRLLDEWGFFDRPEPRLAPYRWLAPLFRLFKPMRIFHFQLGEAAG